jgi:hypothetical protein
MFVAHLEFRSKHARALTLIADIDRWISIRKKGRVKVD